MTKLNNNTEDYVSDIMCKICKRNIQPFEQECVIKVDNKLHEVHYPCIVRRFRTMEEHHDKAKLVNFKNCAHERNPQAIIWGSLKTVEHRGCEV